MARTGTANKANRLASEPSPYLREAAHQPVDWVPWSQHAFARAKREGKPVLVDSGAVWCHWCHVMDHESYEDPATAELINEHFVAIKLDRDERPDVDARLQQAVGALIGRGGWPLTAFLTPDGDVFYGGTYFPPEPGHGLPAFRDVLRQVAHFYDEHPEQAAEQAGKVATALERSRAARKGVLSEGLFDGAVASALENYDATNGGFGRAPKFPHPPTVEVLLVEAVGGGPRGDEALSAALHTLQAMGDGGVYDHLDGGFHRYSVDAHWTVPHFEKMLYDNAGLLRNYAWAGAIAAHRGLPQADALVAKAHDIVRFLVEVLERPEGGFGGSQDADRRPKGGGKRTKHELDDGDYFTWTLDEAAAVLDDDELKLARLHFGLDERGDMQHDPKRNVLEITATPEEIAEGLGRRAEDVATSLERVRAKLHEARLAREAPFVDPSVYTNWNGMAIAALAELHQLHGAPDALAAAVRAAERLVTEAWRDGEGFLHAMTSDGARVAGLLDDQAQMLPALVALHQATGEPRWSAHALALAEHVLAQHRGADGRLVSVAGGEEAAIVADQPTPSAPAQFWLHLPRLARLTGRDDLAQEARAGLEAVAGEVARLDGVFGASAHLAVRCLLDPPPHVVVIGDGKAAERLVARARAAPVPYHTLVRVSDAEAPGMPPEAAEAARAFEGEVVAVVCRGTACTLAHDADELATRLVGPVG